MAVDPGTERLPRRDRLIDCPSVPGNPISELAAEPAAGCGFPPVRSPGNLRQTGGGFSSIDEKNGFETGARCQFPKTLSQIRAVNEVPQITRW